ncbi:MAG: hypothetical protein GXW85_13485, partial [Clostridia bacterium]|nr:hypothetical protein [Clostridia bacterium]
MELDQIKQRIKDRDLKLIEIKKMSDSEINVIKQELQTDYQNLVYLEAQVQEKALR